MLELHPMPYGQSFEAGSKLGRQPNEKPNRGAGTNWEQLTKQKSGPVFEGDDAFGKFQEPDFQRHTF
jgi:hypothetical protein